MERHNQAAPYWAVFLVFCCGMGLSTNWITLGTFWNGYVLDITGPAWTYVLIRGLYTRRSTQVWYRFFSPTRTFFLILASASAIEGMQYLRIYEATYDPWDFLAYASLLSLVYVIDLVQSCDRF